MAVDLFPRSTKPKSRNTQICFVNVRRQHHKCGQAHTNMATETKNRRSFSNMDFSSPTIISFLLHFLLLVSLICPVYSSQKTHQLSNQTFKPNEELHKLKNTIRIHLQKINKPSVKSIQVYMSKNPQLFYLSSSYIYLLGSLEEHWEQQRANSYVLCYFL